MRFLFILFFLPFSIFANPNCEVKGIVTHESNPIPFAIVKVKKKNNQVEKSVKANINGEFSFTHDCIEDKTIEISALGYQSKIVEVKISAELNLGKISLKQNSKQLNEVTIAGNRLSKASNIDKKEYTPSQLLSAQNATASELVNAIPSVNMSNEGGNASFRGDENVAVMINGKISTMTGQNLSQIPATSIEKIEVISVPNSKYNSEGSAGVINIVLKNASANFSGGYILGSIGNNNKWNAQAGYNWNMGKWSFATSYNMTYNEFENAGWSQREYLLNPDFNSYRHISNGESIRRNHALRLGIDYEINKRTTVSLMGNLAKNWGSSYSLDNDTFRTNSGSLYQIWDFHTIEKDPNTLYDINLSLQHIQANMKDKWSIEFSRSDNINDKFLANKRNFELDLANTSQNRDYTIFNVQKRPITAIQTDYTHVINSKNQIETGLRFGNRSFEFANTYLESGIEVPKWTNDFRFEENVSSIYGLLSSNWSKKWTTKLGLRMEQTNTESFQSDTSLYKFNYFKAFPSATIRHQLSEKGFISGSYSMRINRPSPGMLNPLQDVADPISKRLGNPKLEPELINSFELAYGNDISKSFSFSSSVYYKISNNSITRFLSTNPDGTIQVIVDNIGKSTFSGWEWIGSVKATKSINFNLSSNLSYNTLEYTTGSKIYENSYINWQGRGIANIKLPFNIESQIIAFYKSPMKSPQGEIFFTSNVDVSLRKKVWNQKGLIVLTVTDIFNDTKFGLSNSDIDFINSFQRKRETRFATLSFRYNFGLDNNSKKSKIEKMEIKESGGEGGGGM